MPRLNQTAAFLQLSAERQNHLQSGRLAERYDAGGRARGGSGFGHVSSLSFNSAEGWVDLCRPSLRVRSGKTGDRWGLQGPEPPDRAGWACGQVGLTALARAAGAPCREWRARPPCGAERGLEAPGRRFRTAARTEGGADKGPASMGDFRRERKPRPGAPRRVPGRGPPSQGSSKGGFLP